MFQEADGNPAPEAAAGPTDVAPPSADCREGDTDGFEFISSEDSHPATFDISQPAVAGESELADESEFGDDRPQVEATDGRDPIENIAKRAQTIPRPHRYKTNYFRAPPQVDYICRARSATSQSFERSQTPSAIYDPGEMYYRERATYEEKRKQRFDRDCLRRYHMQYGRSPYRYEMARHLEAVQRAFHQECVDNEHQAMQERNLSMLRYRAAVTESWNHEAKLVKNDQMHRVHRCLRILAV
jgi:hypothetical protein